MSVMSRAGLRGAGWLAMASALASLPFFLWSVQNQGKSDPQAIMTTAGMQAVGTGIFVLLMLLLRRFLRLRCSFSAADRVIALMIISNVTICLFTLATIVIPSLDQSAAAVEIITVVAFGLCQFRLGFLLLSLSDDLLGMRIPYAYLNMMTGICLASVLLVPIAVILSAIADVMLGTIFLQAARSIDTTV